MKNMNPIISICIPTYNRADLLRNTITSIYADATDVDMTDFEVIISDNSKDHIAQSVVAEFSYPNLYYHITVCEGFMNSFFSMTYGVGDYIKLNNDYTMFKKGTLKTIINQLKELKLTKRQIIFTNGLRQKYNFCMYDNFDEYMWGLSYFSSWSAGYGMWKEDFDKVKDYIVIDKYFPQTSLLLSQSYKTYFAIDDRPLYQDQHVPQKGGYNIFRVFTVDFVKLIQSAYETKIISKTTFLKIKKDLLYKYISVRYFKTVIARLDNFEHLDVKESVTINYSLREYYKMIIISICAPIIIIYRKINQKIL